jgi:hypothetical protein
MRCSAKDRLGYQQHRQSATLNSIGSMAGFHRITQKICALRPAVGVEPKWTNEQGGWQALTQSPGSAEPILHLVPHPLPHCTPSLICKEAWQCNACSDANTVDNAAAIEYMFQYNTRLNVYIRYDTYPLLRLQPRPLLLSSAQISIS